MLNTKYLSNCNKIKKNVIKMFIPMLFSFKNNKLTKSFYAENKYYKIFYLIYNHISVIRVFFKDKKIFYNFSKYFQINLYIFLIKKKLMILNLFFYFFYTLFLTFENLEDISTNQLFFKGYKHRLKYETFTKGWVKPDHSLKFYFLQRINSISLYVLNFHIYKNFYFSKYNLFLIHTKLIYKLFYYFKLLQYKLQSFVILYRSFYKFEKKIRLFFAKANCVIYKNLNNKLILFFSLYKSFLIKKEQTITNFPVTSLVSNIINLKNNKIKKKNYIKPIYTSHKIKLLLNKKKKILKLNTFKKLKNFFLANYVFNFFFKINLNFSYFNLFYHNILKLNWLKTKILTNKSYYQKIFTNFLLNFLIKYSIVTKLIRRYDINTNEKYFYKILDSFINKLKKIIIIFLLNFFNLINLSEKVKLNFIDFILDKFKFNLLFQTLANCKPVNSLQTFYLIIFNIFEQFLLKNFKISTFYNDKTNLVRYKSRIIYSNSSNNESEDFLLSVIQFHRSYNKKIDQYHTFFNNLIRNKLSNFVLSITDLPEILYYILDYDERYKILKEYFEIHFKKVFAKKKLNNIKKLNKFKRLNQKLSVKLISELKKIQLKKKQKKKLLKLLKKRINFFFNNFKDSKFNYLKQVKTKNLLNYNLRGNNILFNKKLLFFSAIIHLKKRKFTRLIKQNTKKRKLKNVNLKTINLKKQKFIFKIKKNIYNKKKLQYDNKTLKKKIKNLKKKLFKVIKTEKKKKKKKKLISKSLLINKVKRNNKFIKYQKYNKNNNKLFKKKTKKINLKLKLKKFKNEKKILNKLLKKQIIKKYKKYLKKNKKKLYKNYKIKLIKKYGKIFSIKAKNQVIENYIKKKFKNLKKKYLEKNKQKILKNYKTKLIKKYGKIFFNKYNKKKSSKYIYKNFSNFFLKNYTKKIKNLKNKVNNKGLKKLKKKKIRINNNKKFKSFNRNSQNSKLWNEWLQVKKKQKLWRGKGKRKKTIFIRNLLPLLSKSLKIYLFKKFFIKKKINHDKLNKDIELILTCYKLNKFKIQKFISKNFLKKVFLKKKYFKKFFNLKYFNKNKLRRKLFLFQLNQFGKINFNLITKRKKYLTRFFKYYKKYKKPKQKLKKRKNLWRNKGNLKKKTPLKYYSKKRYSNQYYSEKNRRLDEQIRRTEEAQKKLNEEAQKNLNEEAQIKNITVTKKIISKTEQRRLYIKFLEEQEIIKKRNFKLRKKLRIKMKKLKKIMKKLKKNDKTFYKKIKRKIIKKYGVKKFEKYQNKFIKLFFKKLKKKLIKKHKRLVLRFKKTQLKKKKKKKFYRRKYNNNNNESYKLKTYKPVKKQLKLKKNIKLKISPFKVYHNTLQLFKKKIIKLRKFNILKKQKKLKKLNRKKILLSELVNNYITKLCKFYFELKNKYSNIKTKINLIKINSGKFPLCTMNQLNQELQGLKRKLKFFNKKMMNLKLDFKVDFDTIEKKLKNSFFSKKKNYFIKKPLLLKTKFFKIKKFQVSKSSFNKQRDKKKKYLNYYSIKFKWSPLYKKFKNFMKSAYFKKLINYTRHYKRFLEIKKRIKKKNIKFRFNIFLIRRGLFTFFKLLKRKNSKRQKKIKVKKKKKMVTKKKTLLLKYTTKLININLKLFKLNNQNSILNGLKLDSTYLKNLKSNNLLKVAKLNSLKLKFIKLKQLKLKQLKVKKLNFKNSNNKLEKKLKQKLFLLIDLIKKRTNFFFFLKKTNKFNLIKLNLIKLRKLQLKLNKLKLKLNKLILNKLTLNHLTKLKILPLLLKQKEQVKQKEETKQKEQAKQKQKEKAKLKDLNLSPLALELTEKEIKKLYRQHKIADKKLLEDDFREMQKVKDLKKRDDHRYFNSPIDRNATTFDTKVPYKEIKKRHIYRVQKYYRDRQKRLKLQSKHKAKYRIPYTKKKRYYFAQRLLYIHNQLKKFKLFNLTKYSYFFRFLLETRLSLFKTKKIRNGFNCLFLNKLKNSIKNILFKNKSSYYNLITSSLNGINFYNEYKLWHLHFIKLKKIPFNLIRLYAKFYFNKILYNLKLKSTFLYFYHNYLKSCTKVKYFKIKQAKKAFKKKRVKRLAQIIFYKSFKASMKYFIASKNVIFSLIKNGSFYIYYNLYEISRSKMRTNATVSLFLTNFKNKRSFYVSRSTTYSNFFFIYWAQKFYGYNIYGHYKHTFDEFNILTKYFKFFKSKSFFFNYLLNFILSYIQKINLNILNYVFILNQYKTKLIINSNNFYKYLILFHFKRDQYLNFFNVRKDLNIGMPRYFSFFSLFFKKVSIELSNWYSLINNNFLNGYQSTFLFKLCFINHNTNAVYVHYKYKYLYYYRVYNFYIFYIFYYLYNHLFKVYKKLKLKEFKLSYDLIKYNEYNRYYLGLRTRMLILTIRNRYKRGFTVEKIFNNIKFFLRESMKKKELAGYYISIRGRYKRSSRSNKLILKKGVYSFNKIDLKIDSAYGTLNTKYGIAGIKVIFAFK